MGVKINKNGVIFILILILSLPLVQAGFFSDLLNKLIKTTVPNPSGNNKLYVGKYPLILVHGHLVSLKIQKPTDQINSFNNFQIRLEAEGLYGIGYNLKAGEIDSINCGYGTWNPHSSFRITYYDPDYQQSIAVYANRLSKIIDKILYCTGASRVDIVAHSMGGLVARQYRKTSGQSKINKLIELGTPNHGVYRGVKFLAAICDGGFDRIECGEMVEDNQFLEELAAYEDYLNVYTIASYTHNTFGYYGVPFSIEDLPNDESEKILVEGDGVVRTDSVKLNGATNVVIDNNNKCDHLNLNDPKKCPEAYSYTVSWLDKELPTAPLSQSAGVNTNVDSKYDFPEIKMNNADVIDKCNNNSMCISILDGYAKIALITETRQLTFNIKNGKMTEIKDSLEDNPDFVIKTSDKKIKSIYDKAFNGQTFSALWEGKDLVPLSFYWKVFKVVI